MILGLKKFALNFTYIFIGVMLVLLGGCTKSNRLNPEAPGGAVVTPVAYTPKLSTITVPVSFRISALEEKLNQEFRDILYQDSNLDDDNLAVKITKAGLMGMQAENNKIYVTVPVHVVATGRWVWQACKICPTLRKTETTQFNLVVKTESQLFIQEDYGIKSTSVSDFAWGDTKPVLNLGPLKIGLVRFIEPALRNQMQVLSAKMDKEIQNRLKIKEYVQQAWLQVQQPIPLDKALDAWLTVTPQAIRASSVMARNGELSLQIGLSSYVQTVTNGKPTVNPNRNLPRLISDNHLANEVQIGLTSEISYDHATKLLKKEFVNQQFKFSDGKDQLTIHDMALSGSGHKLVVMLDVTGSTQKTFFTKSIAGKIFLKAEPYFDAETQSIRVRNVDYDLDTKDSLLKTASWLAKNQFIHTLEDQINFPLKTQLAEARNLLQQNLNEAMGKNQSLLLHGNIIGIVPEGIMVTPTGIKAAINAQGNLTAQVIL